MHQCDHHDHINKNTDGFRLLAALAVTATFMVVEIVGGIISGSLALVADAVHMSTDAFALALAASAFWISSKPADGNLHFGYRRLQVLSGFVNGILLLLVIGWIVIEAVFRFIDPRPVDWSMMLVVSALGLVANGVAFAILTYGNHDNINIRGAMLHVVGDLLGSVAAVIAAIVIMTTGWLRVDPLLSILVAGLLTRSAVRLVRDSAHILLEGAPSDIDKTQLVQSLKERVPDIHDIHKVQIWQLTPEHPRMTMHVAVTRPEVAAGTLARIKTYLEEHYQSLQSTIQIEMNNLCPDHIDHDHRTHDHPCSDSNQQHGPAKSAVEVDGVTVADTPNTTIH